jgi:hypothetical protein
MEFSELHVEYGYAYASAAVVADGSPPPGPIDDIRVNAPSTRPGAPLPHAWIDDEDGNRCAIKDLVKPGGSLLIVGEDGEAWCEAARARRGGWPPARCAPDRSVRRRSLRRAQRLASPPPRSRATARSSCAPTASSPGGGQPQPRTREPCSPTLSGGSSAARPTAQPPGPDHGRRALDRQGLLATVFLITGLTKLTQPRAKMAAGPMAWAADVTDAQFRTLGLVEVLGEIGLMLPAALGVGPILMPLAALGLARLGLPLAQPHRDRPERGSCARLRDNPVAAAVSDDRAHERAGGQRQRDSGDSMGSTCFPPLRARRSAPTGRTRGRSPAAAADRPAPRRRELDHVSRDQRGHVEGGGLPSRRARAVCRSCLLATKTDTKAVLISRISNGSLGCYSPRRRSLVRRPRFGSWSRSSRRN